MQSTHPTFVRKERIGDGTYEVYSCNDPEVAKSFLAATKVDQKNYYVIVETTDGNWGTDIMGLFLEQLRPWQTNINLTQCEGIVAPYSIFGLQMAARDVNDNFLAKIMCGKCEHNRIDGIRYKSITAVKCPNCQTYNSVDSKNIIVASKEFEEINAKKFELGNQANIAKDFERAFQLFRECYDNRYKAAECAGALGVQHNHLHRLID